MNASASGTVKIVRFHRTGAAEVLQIDDMALPEPGAGEVRLRVHAIGLNRAEVMFRMGQYLADPVLPLEAGLRGLGNRRSHRFRRGRGVGW